MITTIKEYKNIINNKHHIKVVRWSKEIIAANDLKPQHCNWGGFDMYGLSFCSFTDYNDYRYTFWKKIVEKQHGNVVPNEYILDISELKYNTEEDLIKLSKNTYKWDENIRDKAEQELKEMGIYITLSDNNIVEFRVLCDSKVKIYDNK